MKWHLKYLLFFFILNPIYIYNVKPLCISLGSDCEAAMQLRNYGLRKEAYPFDWIMIYDFWGTYQVINENFQYFLHSPFLSTQGNHIYNSHYKIKFFHDFPLLKWLPDLDDHTYGGAPSQQLVANAFDYLPGIQEKYNRRIERFYKTLQRSNKVYFFRAHHINPVEAFYLAKLIETKFPLIDFTLVILHDLASHQEQWNIPHVKSFYSDKIFPVGITKRAPQEEWEKIFKALKLI